MKKTLVSAVLVFVLALTAVALGACTSSSSSGSASSASGSAASASASAASTSSAAASSTSASTASASSAASESSAAASRIELADGTYTAKFKTYGSMFHVNEAYKDQVTLTVKNGEATAHVVLAGKGIINLFQGKKEDAQKEGAVLLPPITEQVKYSDGTTDEAYAFDVPVPVLDEPFDVALVGTKGTWYDHVVTVSDVQPVQ